MLWSTTYVSCISALWAFPILSQPTADTEFVPRGVAAGEAIARRVCAPAAPDVSKSSIIADVCNQTLANDFDSCSDQLTVSIQNSAANTCAQYSSLFTDCLMANKNDSTACPDALLGYQDCGVYTLQAYAYCGCYYTLPNSIADCANQQLQSQLGDAAMAPTTSNTSSNATRGSLRILDGAITADQEPTPSTREEPNTPASSPSPLTSSDPRILADPATADQEPMPSTSEGPTPAPSPSPLPSSDPRIPSAPFETLDTAWSPNATPSASSESSAITTTTVVVTYTSTSTSIFTPAASYYTITITSTATGTIYNTCANNDGIGIGGGARILAATPALTPTIASQNPTGTAETITSIPGDDALSSSSSSSSSEEADQQEQKTTASSPLEETSTSTFFSTIFFSSTPSPFPSQSQPTNTPTPAPASNTATLPPPPSSAPTTMIMVPIPMRNASGSAGVGVCKSCRRGRRSRVFL